MSDINLTAPSRKLLAVGAIQGGLLWALYSALRFHRWPDGQPAVIGGLLALFLTMPLAIYLSHGTGLSSRWRGTLVLGVSGLVAGLGAYAGWALDVPGDAGYTSYSWAFSVGLPLAVLGFVSVVLMAGFNGAQRRWHYPSLFDLAWRNAVLSMLTALLIALFWMVLFAGAWLLNTLGIGFVLRLIEHSLFVIPATCIAVSAAFSVGLARAELALSTRRLLLSVMHVFLPILLFFAAIWLVALPFTGLEGLFRTKSASFMLLWFIALCVHFLNAAWQDGRGVPYRPAMARAVALAWPVLIVVVAVSGWALGLRVLQYGWSADRIWGAFVWLLAAIHVLGYSCSWLPRWRTGSWLAAVAPSNILGAVVLVVGLSLLLSPVADPRRLAVMDQLARLQSGRLTAQTLDYDYLRWQGGRWGDAALRKLAQPSSAGFQADTAARARQVLAMEHRWGPPTQGSTVGLQADQWRADLRRHIQVRPRGRVIDDATLTALQSLQANNYQIGQCLTLGNSCVLWFTQLETPGTSQPGAEEILLIMQPKGVNGAQVLALGDDSLTRWKPLGYYGDRNASLDEWVQAIDAGQARLQTPRWADIKLGKHRLSLTWGAR